MLGPTDVPRRPVDPRDVADRLAGQNGLGPSMLVENCGGTEVLRFSQLADRWWLEESERDT